MQWVIKVLCPKGTKVVLSMAVIPSRLVSKGPTSAWESKGAKQHYPQYQSMEQDLLIRVGAEKGKVGQLG